MNSTVRSMRELYDLAGLEKTRVIHSVGFLLPVLLVLIASIIAGCSSIVSSAGSSLASSLTVAMMNQEDPDLVREAIPSYLLLIDSMIVSDPENRTMLDAGGQLYAAYGAAFVYEPSRAKLLTAHARDYGERALCAANSNACALTGLPYDEFVSKVSQINRKAANELYTYLLTSLAFIRSNSEDYGALADIPKVQYAMEHLLKIGAGINEADTYLYLGVLNTLLPDALGGSSEEGRACFEKSISLSDSGNLPAKVEYARSYARLVYDRELHDRLLNEVISAPVRQSGKTLFNVMAQQQAKALLLSADEYF
jgi:hypothetical protein